MSASVNMDETVAVLQAKLEKSEKSREKMKQVLMQLRDDGKKTAGLLELLQKTQAELASCRQQLQQEQGSHASSRDQLQKQVDQLKQQLERANNKAKVAATGKGPSSAAASAIPVSMASNLEAANKQLKQEQAERRKLQEQVAQLTARLTHAGRQGGPHTEQPEVDALQERVKQLQQELQQARAAGAATAASLESEREQRKTAAATASKELALLRKQLKDAKESARLAAPAAAASHEQQALAAAEQLAQCKVELARARQELEQSRVEARHNRQEAEAAKLQVQQLQASLHELQHALAAQQARADAAQQEASTLQQRLRKLQAQHKQLQVDVAQLQAQLQGGPCVADAAAGMAASTAVAATSSGAEAGVSPQLLALQQQMSSMQHVMADLVTVMDQEQRSKSLAVQLLQGSISGPYGSRQPAAQQSSTYDVHAVDPLARVRAALHTLLPGRSSQPNPHSNGSQAVVQHHPFNAVQGPAVDLEGSQGSGLGPMPACRDAWHAAPGPVETQRDSGKAVGSGGVGLQGVGVAVPRRHPAPHEHTPDHSNLSASTSGSDHGMQPLIAIALQPPLHTGPLAGPLAGTAARQGLWPLTFPQHMQVEPSPSPDIALQCRASYNNLQAAAAAARRSQEHVLSSRHEQQLECLQHLESSKGSGSGPPATFNQVPSSSPSPSPHTHPSPDTLGTLAATAAAVARMAAGGQQRVSFRGPEHTLAHANAMGDTAAVHGGADENTGTLAVCLGEAAKASSRHTAPELEAPIAKRQRLMQGAEPGLLTVPSVEAAPSTTAQKTGRKGRPPKPKSGEELLEPVLTWSDKSLTRGSYAKAAAGAVNRAAKGIAAALRIGACSPAALITAFEVAVLKCVSPVLQAGAPRLDSAVHAAGPGPKASKGGDKDKTPAGVLLGGVGWGGWCLPSAWSSGTVMLLAQAAAGAEQELEAQAAAKAQAAGSSAVDAQPASLLSSLYPRLVAQALYHCAPKDANAAGVLELSEKCALVAAFMEVAHTAGDRQVARGLLDDLLTTHASHTTRHLHILVPVLYAAVSVWPQALHMPESASDNSHLSQVWDPLGACLCAQIAQVGVQAAQAVAEGIQAADQQLLQQLAQGLLQVLASLPQSPASSMLLRPQGGLQQAWLPAIGLCLSVAKRCLFGTITQDLEAAVCNPNVGSGQQSDSATALLNQAQHVLLAAGLHLPFTALLDRVLLPLLAWQPQLPAGSRVQGMALAAALCQGQLLRTKHVLQAPLPHTSASRCMDLCDTLAAVLKASLNACNADDATQQVQVWDDAAQGPPVAYVQHIVVVLTCCVGTLMLPPSTSATVQGDHSQLMEGLLRSRLAPVLQLLKHWARASPGSLANLPDVVRQLVSDFVGVGSS